MKGRIIVIGGPTATGKTALSVAAAKALDGEVVSADSMQIYRRMDIGTAKVTPEEMQGVPHYMIDVVEPDAPFSVAEYQRMASACVDDILSRGKTPILVGGTGLYINSLLYPMTFREYNPQIRAQIEAMYAEKGNEYMYELLRQKAPERAAKLFPNDVKRVGRALELALNGEEHSLGDVHKEPRYDYRMFVLSGDRADLYERINLRVDVMEAKGLVDEVIALLASGVPYSAQSFQAIAYKEMAEYLRGENSYSGTIELIKKRSRNYAKRQLTWFRQYENAVWLDYKEFNSNLNKVIEND